MTGPDPDSTPAVIPPADDPEVAELLEHVAEPDHDPGDDILLIPDVSLADVLCIGPIIGWTLYRLLGTPLAARWLGPHPLRLTLLRASYPSIIAVGANLSTGIPLWLALLVPLPSLFIDDPFIYWAGRRYGKRFTGYLISIDPGWVKRIARGEHAMQKYGVLAIVLGNLPFVPIPIAVVYFLAGDSRMPIWKFVAANLFSLELQVVGLLILGNALGANARTVADKISSYSGYITIGFIVALVLWSIWSTKKNLPQIEAQMRARAEEAERRRRGR